MDCNTARMLTTFFGRQGTELAPEDAADLSTHLAGCAGCASAVRYERAFDDRIARAMLDVPIPSGLKGKLLDGVSAQRGGWYRKKAYGIAGLATAACLLVGGIYAGRILTAPKLEATELIAYAEERADFPQDNIDSYLSSKGVKYNPERRFDLNQLYDIGTSKLMRDGPQVPVLYFKNIRKNVDAKVYIVRDSDFNWKKLPRDGASIPGKSLGLAVIEDARRGDVGYVVIYTGESLELFLENLSAI